MLTLEKSKNSENKEIIRDLFSNLFNQVDDFISGMKLQSSEEILNGSVEEAQKILSEILEYKNFHKKLEEAKVEFDKIDKVSKEDIDEVKEKIESLDQEQIDEEIKEQNENAVEEDITSQVNFRIPILKALIFLGGSSEEVELTDFVKKEMKGKFTKKDLEVPKGEDKERWISNLYFETATMIDEGLLSKDSNNKSWEIAQKGIDYLSKYAK